MGGVDGGAASGRAGFSVPIAVESTLGLEVYCSIRPEMGCIGIDSGRGLRSTGMTFSCCRRRACNCPVTMVRGLSESLEAFSRGLEGRSVRRRIDVGDESAV
jgi:hypothetical protein